MSADIRLDKPLAELLPYQDPREAVSTILDKLGLQPEMSHAELTLAAIETASSLFESLEELRNGDVSAKLSLLIRIMDKEGISTDVIPNYDDLSRFIPDPEVALRSFLPTYK